MSRSLIVYLTSLGLSFFAVTALGEEVANVAAVQRAIAESVVRIEARDCEGNAIQVCSHGVVSSGFLWEDPRHRLVIATTLHGVAYYPQLSWSSSKGRGGPAWIVAVNPGADLALLRVDDQALLALGLRPLKLADTQDLIGKTLISAGFKLGLLGVTTDADEVRIEAPSIIEDLKLGLDTKARGTLKFLDKQTHVLQLQHRFDPGDSGGPLLSGVDVVGIAQAGIRGTSINWAIPTSYLTVGMKYDADQIKPFLRADRGSSQEQAQVIQVFSTDNEVRPTTAIRPPVRYAFALSFSTQTRLLRDYAFRTDGLPLHFTGDWTFGVQPIPIDSEAFPGAELWEQAQGSLPVYASSDQAAKWQLQQRRLAKERNFWSILESASLRLECFSRETLARAGEEDLDLFKLDPDIRLNHSLSNIVEETKAGATLVARDSRRRLYLYSREQREVSIFGSRSSFRYRQSRQSPLSDLDLRGALCSVRLVPRPGGATPDVAELDSALRAGSVCVVLLMGGTVAMELRSSGQSFFASLDTERLYATLTPVNWDRPDMGEPCR